MFFLSKGKGHFTRRLAVLSAAAFLAACQPINLSSTGGGRGPSIDVNAPVPVALLVPGGSAQATDNLVATQLENAARLAIADLSDVRIDLRVYNTSGTAAGAQAAGIKAVDDGAKIILGPVYGGNANAVGTAVASRNVNVLSFSNNTSIAGGNVFVLGPTFENSADRLVAYAKKQGKGRIYIVHGNNLAEETGRDAIRQAIANNGATLAGVSGFELSQQGLVSAIPTIAQNARSSGAQSVFFTSGNDGAMPFLSQLLPENGLSPASTQYIGLPRLDLPAQALSQPGLQGSWFPIPDTNLNNRFSARYNAAFGSNPPQIAGLAYDGIAAIGALVKQGNANALTAAALTRGSGFVGVNGIFRLRSDGTNQRALAIAQIRNNQVVVIDPAPRSFGGAGF